MKAAIDIGIKPIELIGQWDKGWALDKHVISSVQKGENVYGHMEFDTKRTELGELVFQLKYKNKQYAVEKMLELISPFLDRWYALKTVDVVIPVPPSKKERNYQPAFVIAEAIAEYLRKSYVDDVLIKTTDCQAKNAEDKNDLVGSIVATKLATRKCNVLIVDDLFQSGTTLNECVKALKADPSINKVFVLAMTKAKP